MLNENIVVSIICTTFNHEKYIESCLEGFLSQHTDFEYEIIIHDDCSTDNTAEIIRKYVEKEPKRIKAVLQTENQYSKGRDIIGEIMMPMTRGKYIAFCEGDDVWTDKTKLARQLAFIEGHPEYVACVHNTLFHRCDKYCKDFPMFVYNEDRDLGFQDILKWNAFGYQYSSLFVKKEFFVSPPFGYGEYPMAIYLSLNGKIRFLARIMSMYRFRSSKYATRNNVFSRRAMLRENEGTIEGLKKIKDYIRDDDKKNLVEKKIQEALAGLEVLKNTTDEQYNKAIIKHEKLFDLKLFIRSHFRGIYTLIVSSRQ